MHDVDEGDRIFLLTGDVVVYAEAMVAKTSSRKRWEAERKINAQRRVQIPYKIEVVQPSTAVGEHSRLGFSGDCMGIGDDAEKGRDGGDK